MLHESDPSRIVSIDEIERRLRDEPVHRRIGPPPLIDDVRQIIADIRARPLSHLLVGIAGIVVGAAVPIVLAWAWVSFS